MSLNSLIHDKLEAGICGHDNNTDNLNPFLCGFQQNQDIFPQEPRSCGLAE
jgi:hypothetical protein